ncbi:MAG: hypothetical protein HQL74_07240 [Magnetococcales bacterium]|nr:hypothetical protein [Magnetococcales bacterium]
MTSNKPSNPFIIADPNNGDLWFFVLDSSREECLSYYVVSPGQVKEMIEDIENYEDWDNAWPNPKEAYDALDTGVTPVICDEDGWVDPSSLDGGASQEAWEACHPGAPAPWAE